MVATFYVKEADVAIVYINKHDDAKETVNIVEQAGRRCITILGDIGARHLANKPFSRRLICEGIPTF